MNPELTESPKKLGLKTVLSGTEVRPKTAGVKKIKRIESKARPISGKNTVYKTLKTNA